MAAPPKPGRSVFFMPPPAEAETEAAPAAEQSLPIDVYAVLRDHVAYSAAIRSEIRQVRREQLEQHQEMKMKVSELSGKVDTLISVATDIKNRSGNVSGGTGSVPVEQDDPEVERLAKRIDDAIAVLKGDSTAALPNVSPVEPTPVPTSPTDTFDPNAPVTPPPVPQEPSPEALATDINSPQGRDPNAPL